MSTSMKVHLEKEYPCASPIVSFLLASSVSRPAAVSRQALASRLQLLPTGKANNIGGVKAMKDDIDFLAKKGVLTKIGGHSVALSERAWQSAVRLMMEGGGNARTDLKEKIHGAGVNGLDCLAGNTGIFDWIKNKLKSKSQKNADVERWTDVERWVQNLKSRIAEKQEGSGILSDPSNNKIVQTLVDTFHGLWCISQIGISSKKFQLSFNDNGTVQTWDFTTKNTEPNWKILFQTLMTKFNRTAEQVAKGFFSQGMLEQSIQSAVEGFFQDRIMAGYFHGRPGRWNSSKICSRVLSDQNFLPKKQKEGHKKNGEWCIVENKQNEEEAEEYAIYMRYNSEPWIIQKAEDQYKYDKYIFTNQFWFNVFQQILIYKIKNHQAQQPESKEITDIGVLESLWNPEQVRNEFAWYVSPCRKMRFQQEQVTLSEKIKYVETELRDQLKFEEYKEKNAQFTEKEIKDNLKQIEDIRKTCEERRKRQIDIIVTPKFKGMTFEDWKETDTETKLTEYLSFNDPSGFDSETLQERAKDCIQKCNPEENQNKNQKPVKSLWYMEKKLVQNKEDDMDIATIRVIFDNAEESTLFKYIRSGKKPQENKKKETDSLYYLKMYEPGTTIEDNASLFNQVKINNIISSETGRFERLKDSKITTMLDKMFRFLNTTDSVFAPANFLIIRPEKEGK